MSINFQVNDKVVCIFDEWHHWVTDPDITFHGPLPVKNQVYVVEKIISVPTGDTPDGRRGLRLVGHTSFNARAGGEVGYAFSCFRKLDEFRAEQVTARSVSRLLRGFIIDHDE